MRNATNIDLLQERIVRDPDDIDARLRYAEAISGADPDRAEFITISVTLEREGDASFAMQARQRSLLARHGARWTAHIARYLAEPERGYAFKNGFVEFVRISAQNFILYGETLRRLEPIRHLNVSFDEQGDVIRFFSSPALQGIRSLGCESAKLTDAQVHLLSGSPFLGELRWLSLQNNPLTKHGARALADSTRLPNLGWVNLSRTGYPVSDYITSFDDVTYEVFASRLAQDLETEIGRRIPWLHIPVSAHRPVEYPDRFRI